MKVDVATVRRLAELSKLSFSENEETWELIDDIDGLNDVLEESDKNDLAQELYPGLIYIKK